MKTTTNNNSNNVQTARRHFIVCKMYLTQKDYKGLSNFVLMNYNYLFFNLVDHLIRNLQFDQLLSFFEQKIRELVD